MLIPAVALVLLAGLLALGGWERWRRDRAYRRVPIRIHVNGTRGKSTVTRLIASALRASGRRTLAKTTGTAARLILPDGAERPLARRGPANIREQLWCLREADRCGAGAIVLECMAINPVLQDTSERDIVRATIGVITNARADHGDVMGMEIADVERALAHTVPASAVLVLGQVPHVEIFEAMARERHTRVVLRSALASVDGRPEWERDNLALALAVTRELGIADDVALAAMASAPEDPGAVRTAQRTIAGRPVAFVNAAAANDPESLQMVLDRLAPSGDWLFVFNHRSDRPVRLRQFAASAIWQRAGTSVLITGDRPDWATRRIVSARLGFSPMPRLASTLRNHLAGDARVGAVVLCGNTKHFDVDALVGAVGGA